MCNPVGVGFLLTTSQGSLASSATLGFDVSPPWGDLRVARIRATLGFDVVPLWGALKLTPMGRCPTLYDVRASPYREFRCVCPAPAAYMVFHLFREAFIIIPA